MRQIETTLKQALGAAAMTVAFAVTGPMLAIAQETTTTTEASTTEEAVVISATQELICEANQRAEARYKKWVEEGIPEEFGSEEPFTFDPSLC